MGLNTITYEAATAGPTQYALAVASVISAAGAWVGVFVQRGNAKRQIDSAQRALSEQLAASAKLASQQIEAAARNTAQQARASVIATSRQRWVDAVRDDVAHFLAHEESYRLAQSSGETRSSTERNRELLLLMRRIQLRLNPSEPRHQNLLRALMKVIQESGLGTAASDEVLAISHEIFESEAQAVMAEAGGELSL